MTTPSNKPHLITSKKSWGRLAPTIETMTSLHWSSQSLPKTPQQGNFFLPYGKGRSYGDSCTNDGHTLLPSRTLDHFISFDPTNGVMECESGVTLANIIALTVPQGWFLPVTPGTRFVTVGGAVANDVHGKNHHVAGTFGCHVLSLELLRSTGERIHCSPHSNRDLFCATIGGLGLTGFITKVQFKMTKIPGAPIRQWTKSFSCLEEFEGLSTELEQRHEYVVSWLDCLNSKAGHEQGIIFAGDFTTSPDAFTYKPKQPSLFIPFELPSFMMNRFFLKMFNRFYAHSQRWKKQESIVDLNSFFYPLDSIDGWNRCYGKKGFHQYQFVIPTSQGAAGLRKILRPIFDSQQGSFLAVLKKFGMRASPGLLSFPRPGFTLALDFAHRGQRTLDLLTKLDQVVLDLGGALYPAKDARMPSTIFHASYLKIDEFRKWRDPMFSSQFSRRVEL